MMMDVRAGITKSVDSRSKEEAGFQSRRFQRYFEASGLTQAELADRCEVHINTVSRWATGKTPTPGAVISYLALYSRVRDLLE
jgi:DNA-binding transcriptional regulator YiaG